MAFSSNSGKEDNEDVIVTPNGKEIVISPDAGKGCLYKVQFKSGGQLPKEFKGNFTSRSKAKEAVTVYLARLEREGVDKEAKAKAKKESK